MPIKNKVTVKIVGKDYTIIGDESEEYIQKVGLYIDKKLGDTMRNSVTLSTNMAHILTSLNVADEFFKAREAENYYKDELQRVKKELEDIKTENETAKSELEHVKRLNKELKRSAAKRDAYEDLYNNK